MVERTKPKNKKAVVLLVILIVIASLGILYLNREGGQKSTTTGLEKGQSVRNQQITTPTTAETTPEAEKTRRPETAATSQSSTAEPAIGKDEQCRQVETEILRFFSHLAGQDYIIDHQLKEGVQPHIRRLIDKLFANPPVVVRETDDLLAVLKNMAHFFRIIGGRDIFLIKEILARERGQIEPAMADFYQWSEIGRQCKNHGVQIKLPLQGLYEYAGFFLNTLGGQSYLFRREPRIRLLVKYYAILILDRANMEKINLHGIDIRFPLHSLIEEMEVTSILSSKENYLKKLRELRAKYQSAYGSNTYRLSPIAHKPQKAQEKIDKIQIQGQSPHYSALPDGGLAAIHDTLLAHCRNSLHIVGGQPGKNKYSNTGNHPGKLVAPHEDIYYRREDHADKSHEKKRPHAG